MNETMTVATPSIPIDAQKELQSIIDKGEGLMQGFLSIDGRLLSLQERLLGALPATNVSDSSKPVQTGSVGQIHELMDRLGDIQSYISLKLECLEQL